MVRRSSRFGYTSHKLHQLSLEEDRLSRLTTPALATASTFRYPAHTDRSLHGWHNFTREVWADPFSLAATKGMDSLATFPRDVLVRENVK
jgi:hypothetical protein